MKMNSDPGSSPNMSVSVSDSNQRPISISIDRFSHLVGYIYEAAQEPTAWSSFLEEVRNEFSANFVSLIVRQGTTHDLGFIVSAAGEKRVFEPDTSHLATSPFSG